MANLFGLNITQAMAMQSINPTLLGGLSARLKKNGVNINEVNATGIQRISEIEANKGLSEGEKDRLIKEAATQNQEKTQGSEIREGLAGVERATVSMADKLLDPLIAIRAGIMYMAGEGGKHSPRQIQEAVLKSENKDKLDLINGKYNKLLEAQQERIDKTRGKADTSYSSLVWQYRGDDAGLQRALAERDAAKKEQKAAILEMTRIENERTQKLKEQNDELQKNIEKLNQAGVTVGPDGTVVPAGGGGAGLGGRSYGTLSGGSLFDRLLQMESGGRHVDANGNIVTSSKGARGIAQLMPGTAKNPGFGITPVRDDSASENMRVGREYLGALLGKYGGDQAKALAAYNAGFARVDSAVAGRGNGWLSGMPAETRNYVAGILGDGTPLPATGTGAAGGAGKQEIHVKGEVTVNLPGGRSVTAPLEPSGRVRTPTPQGAR
jgi:hypothetical protein